MLRLAKIDRAAGSGRGAGAGTTVVQELRSQIAGIIAVKPTGDKASHIAEIIEARDDQCPISRLAISESLKRNDMKLII
jgi:hypothetical protein